jgi:hypothetical protein
MVLGKIPLCTVVSVVELRRRRLLLLTFAIVLLSLIPFDSVRTLP